jgi:hypothetical protein
VRHSVNHPIISLIQAASQNLKAKSKTALCGFLPIVLHRSAELNSFARAAYGVTLDWLERRLFAKPIGRVDQ